MGLGTKWFPILNISLTNIVRSRNPNPEPPSGVFMDFLVLNSRLPPLALGLVKLNGVPLRVFDMEFVFESNLGGVKSNFCCRYLSFGNQKHQCHS